MLFIDGFSICTDLQLSKTSYSIRNICTTYYFDRKIKPLVIKYSRIYNVEPHYIFGIIAAESRFKINAKNVNRNGTIDKGLMQINSSNFDYLSKEFNVKDIRKKSQ